MKLRPLPTEIWALRRPDGGLVPPLDDDRADSFLAYPRCEQAERGLAHQVKMYDLLGCFVIRLDAQIASTPANVDNAGDTGGER